MTHTHAEFVAAICAAPAEDTPRLVYADWLEEHEPGPPCSHCKGEGVFRGGHVKCDGRGIHDGRWEEACVMCKGAGHLPNPRAEFIRTQVALHNWDGEAGHKGLIDRQDSLLATFGVHWARPWARLFYGKDARPYHEYGCVGGAGQREWKWSRGFVAEFRISAEDWSAHADAFYWHPGENRPCPETAQPLERVVLTTMPRLVSCRGGLYARFSGRWKELAYGSGRTWDQMTPDLLAADWPHIDFTLPQAGYPLPAEEQDPAVIP